MGGKVEKAAQIVNGALRQRFHEDSDGTMHIRTFQDVEPHLEYCKAMRREEAEQRGRFGKRGEFRRTLSTPTNIYYAVCQKLGLPLRRVFDTDVSQRITQEIKTDFPMFKTTNDKRI